MTPERQWQRIGEVISRAREDREIAKEAGWPEIDEIERSVISKTQAVSVGVGNGLPGNWRSEEWLDELYPAGKAL